MSDDIILCLSSDDDGPISDPIPSCSRKRNLSSDGDSSAKRIKTDLKVENPFSRHKSFALEETKSTNNGKNNIQPKTDKKRIVPQLVVKKIERIIDPQENVFVKFLDSCLKIDETDELKNYLDKIKQKYTKVDPIYLQSESFKRLILDMIEKMNKSKKVYTYLKVVTEEMKKRRLKTSKTNSIVQLSNNQMNQYDKEAFSKEDIKKLKILEEKMQECKKKIVELEDGVIDWDDLQNSDYIKEDRYKRKYMELYTYYCKLLGEECNSMKTIKLSALSKDQMTGYEKIDEAIIININSEIKRFNKLRREKPWKMPEYSYVPDYAYVFDCITKCVKHGKYNLSNRDIEDISQRTFKTIVTFLKKVRQKESLEAIIYYIEDKPEDPAVSNDELKKKLEESYRDGELQLKNVFDEFAKKQSGLSEEDLKKQLDPDDEETDKEDGDEDEDESDCVYENEEVNDEQDRCNKTRAEIFILENNSINNTINKTVSKEDIKEKSSKVVDQDKLELDREKERIDKRKNLDKVTEQSEIEIIPEFEIIDEYKITKEVSTNLEEETFAEYKRKPECQTVVAGETTPEKKSFPCNNNSEKSKDIPSAVHQTSTDIIKKIISEDSKSKKSTTSEDEDIIILDSPKHNQSINNEKVPLLKLKSFAKTPTSWMSPPDNSTSALSRKSHAVVDLTFEADSGSKPNFTRKIFPVKKKFLIPREKTVIIKSVKNLITRPNYHFHASSRNPFNS